MTEPIDVSTDSPSSDTLGARANSTTVAATTPAASVKRLPPISSQPRAGPGDQVRAAATTMPDTTDPACHTNHRIDGSGSMRGTLTKPTVPSHAPTAAMRRSRNRASTATTNQTTHTGRSGTSHCHPMPSAVGESSPAGRTNDASVPARHREASSCSAAVAPSSTANGPSRATPAHTSRMGRPPGVTSRRRCSRAALNSRSAVSPRPGRACFPAPASRTPSISSPWRSRWSRGYRATSRR